MIMLFLEALDLCGINVEVDLCGINVEVNLKTVANRQTLVLLLSGHKSHKIRRYY